MTEPGGVPLQWLTLSVPDVLASRPYPGRKGLVSRTAADEVWFAYFLTGRSAASRARAMRQEPSGDVLVVHTASDEHDDRGSSSRRQTGRSDRK